ncbi:MAG TPA: hypothetical protein VIY98_06825 [Nitrososphaeraceae archaeon]|jgi:hypothetical protein
MSGNDNDNEFPYGKYPNNLLKLFEKSYENREGKERKLLYCIAWCKDLIPETKPQVLMDICVESYKTKGKFLHEMDKDEVKRIMKDFE